jgi:DNA-binding phage protein
MDFEPYLKRKRVENEFDKEVVNNSDQIIKAYMMSISENIELRAFVQQLLEENRKLRGRIVSIAKLVN